MLAQHPVEWWRHGQLADAGNAYRALEAAPSAATDGIAIPPASRSEYSILSIRATAAGAFTFSIVIYGWIPAVFIDVSGTKTAISGATATGWFDAGQIDVTGTTSNNEAHSLQALAGFTRLYARAISLVGAPTIHCDFGFSRHVEV